ncbi:energy transducer TonB family protein [Yersinia pekkanenii]|uniref:TonB protein n=1 Tax=Yersinia pekkanenii TaxID=1288385 RepID=A0A0T9QL47_9GAMM|nr:energy transducer TonB [Yersinia pekkanenii]CNI16997.1 putative TonB protein [Yersinia pekkanenii]CRY68480.1 putative TonB protein [Yersinia pekkanenii]
MTIRENNNRIFLWWGSALFTGSTHLYLLWLLSTEAVPVKHTDHSPVAVMLTLSAETEFTPNLEQNTVVGLTQDFNEPQVERSENQPEEVPDLLTAPEQPDAFLIVEKELEVVKKQPTKTKRPQKEVIKPRKPIIEETAENRSKPSPPAAVASTTLSGDSHQIAAASNSDSLHKQQIKMNWKNRVNGHLRDFKRYPPSARKQRQQGTATIRFSVNQNGDVLSAQLINSSGVAILDHEALAVIKRAQPLPRPPAELLLRGPITLTLAIGFDLKKINQ